MRRKIFLLMMILLCVLAGACSRQQKQQAAGAQTAASEEKQKLEQQLAEQQKKLDEQQKKLEEQQLTEQQKAEAAPSVGQSAGDKAASQPSQAAAPAPKPPAPVYTTLHIPAGTPVVVRTTVAMSTKTAKPGDTFAATLEEGLTDNGKVVATRGAEVAGRIVESDPGGRTKGKAKISVELVSLTTADGKRIPISTVALTQEAGSTVKKDVKRTGIAAGVGAGIGAIAGGGKGAAIGAAVGAGTGVAANLATRGDPSVIPSETVLRFELTQTVAVKTRVDQTSKAE